MASSGTGSGSNISANTSFTKRVGGTPLKGGVSLAKKRRAAAAAKSTKVTLESVLGLTCHSSSSLGVSDSYVAYPAGCVAVLQDVRKKNKKLHLINKKPISCLCLSGDGEYLATGEYGHEPCARVWDLKERDPVPCSTLKAHSFGVKLVAFTFGHKYLITIGYRYDRQVIVWHWKTGVQIMFGKYGQPVNSMAISEDHTSRAGPNYFVTAHPRRVQYWYYDPPKEAPNKKKPATTILKARSTILGDLQDNNFVAVVCGSGPLSANTYALARSGKVLLFDNLRLVDKFTEIKASPAHSLVLTDSYLFCGCSDGVIRLFDPYSLDYVITLPYPHPLGVDISAPVVAGDSETLHYPDAIAMVINSSNKLSVVYNDHSFYVWDVSNVKQVGKNRSFLFHSSCVWDISTYPFMDDESKQLLPESSFVTCSSDNTIRFWCLEPNSEQWNIRNIYSKELIRVVYNDSVDINCLKDVSVLPGDASAVADASRGVRSIAIHGNGQHLAAGDREGNLRIYDLQFMDKVYEEVAHDAEILSLSYSNDVDGVQFLATASRDRMVHIFSKHGENSYQPLQSLPDHSAAVTAVGFTGSQDRLQLLSSGADKSILFHMMEKDDKNMPVFTRSKHIVSKASIYDMAIDAFEKYFLTAGQDKFIRMYGVNSAKKCTVIKVPTSDDGSIIKVTLDPSGLYAACSVGDKSVLIFDIYNGECIAKLCGHSEVVTQVKFSKDCKQLYTVSGDSCIFVWKLWPELIKTMHERLAEISQSLPNANVNILTQQQKLMHTVPGAAEEADVVASEASNVDTADMLTEQEMLMLESEQPDFDFRLSMLPTWARKAAMSRPSMAQHAAARDLKRVHSAESAISSRTAEGKWAERVAGSQLTFASDAEFGQDLNELPVQGLSKPQRRKSDSDPPIVIDITEAALDELVAESPEQVIADSPPKASSGDSDVEGEVLYNPSSTHHLDVDPSMFSVTTPCKPATREDVDEEEESVTPNISPPMVHRPAHFLEANYQSLEKVEDEEEAGRKLNAISSRLSISSRFLRKHSQMQLLGVNSSNLDLGASASAEEPLTLMGGGSMTSPMMPPPIQGFLEVKKEMLFPDGRDTLGDGDAQRAEKGTGATAERGGATAFPHEEKNSEKAASERASKASFEREVSETKKRLLDLGYNVPAKEDSKSVIDVEENEGQQEPRLKEMGPQVVGALQATTSLQATNARSHKGIGIRKAREIEGREETKKRLQSFHPYTSGAEPFEHGGAKTLSARASSAMSSLEATFRTLTILSAEAVKGNDPSAAASISKGLTAHKVKVVSWSNRNRKSWRKKGKGGSATTTPPGSSLDLRMRSSEDPVCPGVLPAPSLGPREIEQASALVDQLKKLLSQ